MSADDNKSMKMNAQLSEAGCLYFGTFILLCWSSEGSNKTAMLCRLVLCVISMKFSKYNFECQYIQAKSSNRPPAFYQFSSKRKMT